MYDIVAQTHKILIKKKKTLAVAESCTGGLVSSLLTRIGGSSKYYILGIVAYHNKIKAKILGVSPRLLAEKGAVSQAAAIKMSQGVRQLFNTDYAIGITGIAGPGGGSLRKPVGTVFIAISGKNQIFCKKFHFQGSRSAIMKKAALNSLELLYAVIHCH